LKRDVSPGPGTCGETHRRQAGHCSLFPQLSPPKRNGRVSLLNDQITSKLFSAPAFHALALVEAHRYPWRTCVDRGRCRFVPNGTLRLSATTNSELPAIKMPATPPNGQLLTAERLAAHSRNMGLMPPASVMPATDHIALYRGFIFEHNDRLAPIRAIPFGAVART
jgi:hypothetical protein